jgi:hypothetical protein
VVLQVVLIRPRCSSWCPLSRARHTKLEICEARGERVVAHGLETARAQPYLHISRGEHLWLAATINRYLRDVLQLSVSVANDPGAEDGGNAV